ncbi:IS110 family transposase, partial [Escherichia coli]|nr:IS110 family transposase [Escherichia coli]
MYKANRRDGLCERSLTMFPVGIDVSKKNLDLCMLYDGIKGRIKT